MKILMGGLPSFGIFIISNTFLELESSLRPTFYSVTSLETLQPFEVVLYL